MKGLLICTGKRTEQPLFIYETKTNIYSVEELCRYIFENVETIEDKFFDARLSDFFKRCEREDIALRLNACFQKKASMEDIVRSIFSYVNYYEKGDIEQLCSKIRAFEGQPVEERLKALGDSLLRAQKYAMAERQYKRLLEMNVKEYMNAEFYGRLWHNLGVVYMRMLYYKDAVDCFETAYETFPDEIIKLSLLRALKLIGNDERLMELVYDETMSDSFEEQFKTDEAAAFEQIKDGKVAECMELYNKGQMAMFHEKAEELIKLWKAEYREQMK